MGICIVCFGINEDDFVTDAVGLLIWVYVLVF